MSAGDRMLVRAAARTSDGPARRARPRTARVGVELDGSELGRARRADRRARRPLVEGGLVDAPRHLPPALVNRFGSSALRALLLADGEPLSRVTTGQVS